MSALSGKRPRASSSSKAPPASADRHGERHAREEGDVERQPSGRERAARDDPAEDPDRDARDGQLEHLAPPEVLPRGGAGRPHGGGRDVSVGSGHHPMSETPYLMTLYMIAVR